MRRVTKAVFPVAGMGTRFLPATKANPKEMLSVVDKPLIQYAVEEAVEAGVTDLIFINGRNKRAIPDHFDKAYELESELEAKGKTKLLNLVRSIIPDHVNCIYIRQPQSLGLGHAVLCAEPAVNNEPFAVILADDLIDAQPGVVSQMLKQFDYYNCTIVGVQNVARKETDQYGIVVGQPLVDTLSRVTAMVEKPSPEVAPSTLGVVGRYVFTPRIFEHLRHLGRGTGGEIQLTDGIVSLLQEQQVLAYEYQGKRYDCGSKLGFLQANVEHALKHPELADDFGAWLDALHAARHPS